MVSSGFKTWVEVSKNALENNVQVIRRLAPEKTIMAVVKSNAYGHGLVKTSWLLLKYGANWIGTDSLDEALLLRKVGIKAPILVLGYTGAGQLAVAAYHRVRVTLYDAALLEAAAKLGQRLIWHLKIDTGMSRQGVTLADLPNFITKLKNYPHLHSEGVFTHFANADDLPALTYARKQVANFYETLKTLRASGRIPSIVHAAATPAFFSLPEASFDLIRIGIGFYGLWPSEKFKSSFQSLGLRPALSWKTRVVQIKNIKNGTPVGYGITEKVGRDSTIAVLPVGYYDGCFRGLSSIGSVLISGQRCKILGRISMNLCVADITKVRPAMAKPFCGVWDEVVLIGRQGQEEITAEEIAQKIGTISYEVVARINPLLPRIYV